MKLSLGSRLVLVATTCLWAIPAPCPAQDATASTPAAKTPEPIRVMFLGMYHFGNPNQDLHDVKADNMLAPKRQEEIADVANRLARFSPTKIAVEDTPKNPAFTDTDYEKFTPADLTKDANETTQIGYRLAHQLGQQAVYDIDEQSKTIDYFPFTAVEEFAKAHGQTSLLDKMHASVEADMAEVEAVQKTQPVRLALALLNDPAKIAEAHQRYYYSLLQLGERQSQPGADLNAMWYARNAKIFAKLIQVTKPGDRVVVVFGSGHGYWLRHFIANTPGFVLEDPLKYLK